MGQFIAQQISLLAPAKRVTPELTVTTGFKPPLLKLTPLLRQLCLLSLQPQSSAMQQHLLAMWHLQLSELGA